MHHLLQTTFVTSESLRKQLLREVEPFSKNEKFFASPEGRWSVSQILSHLIHAERLSLEYMKKKALGIDKAGDTGIAEAIKFNLLLIRVPRIQLTLTYGSFISE